VIFFYFLQSFSKLIKLEHCNLKKLNIPYNLRGVVSRTRTPLSL